MTANRRKLSLVLMLLVCFGVSAFGALFTPGEWYQSLHRAPWSPPNIAFPIVWSILYVLIAIAGWLIYCSTPNMQHSTKMFRVWIAQLMLNGLWSWVFFGLHQTQLALLDMLLIDCLVVYLAYNCFIHDLKLAAYLLAPYLLWLLLATTLNAYVVVMN